MTVSPTATLRQFEDFQDAADVAPLLNDGRLKLSFMQVPSRPYSCNPYGESLLQL